jgi:hypothetical protein
MGLASAVILGFRSHRDLWLRFLFSPRHAHILGTGESETVKESELLYDGRFTTNQFVLAPRPWGSRPELFFLQLNPYARSPCVTSSLTRRWCFFLWSVHIEHVACYSKFFLLYYMQVLCQSRLCKADHASRIYFMLQGQLSHFNGRKLDHRQI